DVFTRKAAVYVETQTRVDDNGHDHGDNNGENGKEAQDGEMQDDEDDTMKDDGWDA
ncbi:MAG: hypothetical protein Q9226_000734, partial [Calogaya cf. arnoldii]